MKKIFSYLAGYCRWLQLPAFSAGAFFIAAAIFCNYYFNINAHLNTLPAAFQFLGWYGIFLIVFLFGFFIQLPKTGRQLFQSPMPLSLLALAPAVFAWKMMSRYTFSFSEDAIRNAYWNHVAYWPLKLVVVTAALWIVWKIWNPEQPFYGFASKNFSIKPYLFLLLFMVPLLCLAATQPDFLDVYPKLKNIAFLSHGGTWYHTLLYELSYGSDFFTIELFFRGFLVLAFARWVGNAAVLPMALFYCTIHFGKPLGECISSFFGGLILGAVTLNTRSIWGGLIVHLGIAWLMEVAGFFGRNFSG